MISRDRFESWCAKECIGVFWGRSKNRYKCGITQKAFEARKACETARAVEIDALRSENAELKAKITDMAKGEDDGIR